MTAHASVYSQAIATEMAQDEAKHVAWLQAQLGLAAIPMPQVCTCNGSATSGHLQHNFMRSPRLHAFPSRLGCSTLVHIGSIYNGYDRHNPLLGCMHAPPRHQAEVGVKGSAARTP